jgi:hypothetical protein
MRKRLSILIALAAAAMIAVATVIPAFATEYYTPLDASYYCVAPAGSYVEAQVELDTSSSLARVANTYADDCDSLFVRGYAILYNGQYVQMSGGGWTSGFPAVVTAGPYAHGSGSGGPTDVKQVDNQYNFCDVTGTMCYGFSDFVAP